MPPLPSLAAGQILTGALFNEPMRVETVAQTSPSDWTVGLVGTRSERFRKVSLGTAELAGLTVLDSGFRYDGDGALLRLGLQAHALGIAWEFDPYFGLSVSRVDPLPHQLEAVYDHLLKLPRVRFLLADDAGAGKTIMAGLLIRELQLRGLAERVLIVAPSNLAFQWQRELQEKFDETFVVMKGDDLRAQFGVNQWMRQKKVVTSLDLAKRDDILPGLRQTHWDLVVVDEAHRMSAPNESHKSQRYKLGELLRDSSDHILLLTATPHKGDPKNFSLFLQLLDRDAYADVRSIREAMDAGRAPFYLRRTKEAMVYFPQRDENGEWVTRPIFTKRIPRTVDFKIDGLHGADAAAHRLPDQAANVWFTDPPYYDAVPYAHLADFFFVWLRRTIPDDPLLRGSFESRDFTTPKAREIVVDRPHRLSTSRKDAKSYEQGMAQAFAEGRRVLRNDGVGSVVFAHKTTEGWEALLSGMIQGGWTLTGSWPIATEMSTRPNARETASLATSIHLVCRPRSDAAPVGEWAVVLRELPQRVGEWMERLQRDGIRGADLVFACIGPALEREGLGGRRPHRAGERPRRGGGEGPQRAGWSTGRGRAADRALPVDATSHQRRELGKRRPAGGGCRIRRPRDGQHQREGDLTRVRRGTALRTTTRNRSAEVGEPHHRDNEGGGSAAPCRRTCEAALRRPGGTGRRRLARARRGE